MLPGGMPASSISALTRRDLLFAANLNRDQWSYISPVYFIILDDRNRPFPSCNSRICEPIIDKNVESFHLRKIEKEFSQFSCWLVDITLRSSNELFVTKINIIQY